MRMEGLLDLMSALGKAMYSYDAQVKLLEMWDMKWSQLGAGKAAEDESCSSVAGKKSVPDLPTRPLALLSMGLGASWMLASEVTV